MNREGSFKLDIRLQICGAAFSCFGCDVKAFFGNMTMTMTMTMTMKKVLFDHKYMYVHNILYFRKCKYKSVWRLLLRQNSLSLS